MAKMRALFAGKRYYAEPHYEGVTLTPVDEVAPPIAVPYSDTRLQLEPVWWRWHQPLTRRLTTRLTQHQTSTPTP